MADRIGKPISQRQLRVGEMIKQSLSMIFLRNEAKVPNLETNTITVTNFEFIEGILASFLIKSSPKFCFTSSPTLNCL